MICHLVFYRMKPGTSATDEIKLIANARRDLAKLPGVKNLKVGRNIRPSGDDYLLALSMDFEDETALETYRVHPEHQAFIKRVVEPVVKEVWRFDLKYEN